MTATPARVHPDARAVVAVIKRAVTPRPRIEVSAWADEHRLLTSRTAAIAGPWSTDRTPYLREIMNALSPHHPAREVVFVKPAQVGGTEAGNNWIGYSIHWNPAPILLVMPTLEMAKRNGRQRIDPMVSDSPALRGLVTQRKSRAAGNTMTVKEFPGGLLILTGANSPIGLRSTSAGRIMFDELDAYPATLGEEGDPVALAEARARTFDDRKIYKVSTPKVRGRSRIWAAYEKSDQRRFFVPCPLCGFEQSLEFSRLVWDEKTPRAVSYRCLECEALIDESEKIDMLERGRWQATAVPSDPECVGFHLSGLYSPFRGYGWGHCVGIYRESLKHPDLSPVFFNTILGEPYADEADAPDWQRLYERRDLYDRGTIPAGGLLLVAGADVQIDRIELGVWAYGREREAWAVEHMILEGDPARPEVWRKLDEAIARPFPCAWAPDASMRIRACAVDSAAFTSHVFAFVRKHHQPVWGPAGAIVDAFGTVLAIRGSERDSPMLVYSPRGSATGRKKRRRGAALYLVNENQAKTELYTFLRLPRVQDGQPAPPGYLHFPQGFEPEWFKQLVSERKTIKYRRGYPVPFWEKDRGHRNEVLDCWKYARAAAELCGLSRRTEAAWRALERALPVPVPPAPAPEAAPRDAELEAPASSSSSSSSSSNAASSASSSERGHNLETVAGQNAPAPRKRTRYARRVRYVIE